MKRITVIVLLLAVLFIFPFNSFGKPIVYPLIYTRQGPVEGLVFYFDPPLYVELPGYEPFDAAYVEIKTSGTELVIITKKMEYLYFGDYGKGKVYAWDSIEASGKPVKIPMQSAQLTERFTLESLPENPFVVSPTEDVDLYFQAKLGTPGNTFTFVLVIWDGEIVWVDVY